MVAAAAAVADPAPVESGREEMTVVVIATTAAGADTGPTDVCKRCCQVISAQKLEEPSTKKEYLAGYQLMLETVLSRGFYFCRSASNCR